MEYGSELLFNAYAMTPGSGSVQTGSNATSVAKYGTRTIERTLLSSTTDAENIGIYYIGLHDEPTLRVSKVVLQAIWLKQQMQKRFFISMFTRH